MPTRLSIVMPSFNQGPFIKEAIDSVLNQDFRDVELIVMDGGSKDETLDILSSVAANDPRLRWSSEPDRGQAHAVNKAIRRSKAPIIGWLNSDDIFYPESFKAVLRHFDDHPEVDVVYGEGDHLDSEGRFLRRHPTEQWNISRLNESVIMPQPSVFLRRAIVERGGLLDESLHYCLDYEYWLRLAQAGASFQYIPWVLSGTRMHESAKTVHHRRAMHEEINGMLRRHLGVVPATWLLNYACVAAGIERRIDWALPARALAVLPVAFWAAWKWNGTLEARAIAEFGRGLSEKASRAWQRRHAA